MKFLKYFVFLVLLVLMVPVSVFAYEQRTTVVDLVSQDTVIESPLYFKAAEEIEFYGTSKGEVVMATGALNFDGIVQNDLIVAAQEMTLKGVVGQDLRIAGVKVDDQLQVFGNATLIGDEIIVGNDSKINGSLTVVARKAVIQGKVLGDVYLVAESVVLNGTIDGNVTSYVQNLDIGGLADIKGDVIYTSENGANLSSTATVSGELQRKQPAQVYIQRDIQDAGKGLTTFFQALKIINYFTVLLIGLLLLKLFPQMFVLVDKKMKVNYLKTALVGFAVLLVYPLIFILLIVTLIGIPLAFTSLYILGMVIFLSKVFVAFVIGTYFKKSVKNEYVCFAIGLLIYYLATLVPGVGLLMMLVVLFLGVGVQKMLLWERLKSNK